MSVDLPDPFGTRGAENPPISTAAVAVKMQNISEKTDGELGGRSEQLLTKTELSCKKHVHVMLHQPS